MKYLITEEIESPNRVFKNVEALDFFCSSAFNRKRRNMESVFLLLKHNTAVYKAVYGEEVQGLAAEIEKE